MLKPLLADAIFYFEKRSDNIKSLLWWRRRDSNPGPEVLLLSVYMLNLPIIIRDQERQ